MKEKRFYATPDLAFTTLLCFGVGIMLMLVPIISSGAWVRLLNVSLVIAFLFVLFWFFATRGTYISINEEKIVGKIMFIPGKTVYLSSVVSLSKRKTFGGLITELYTVNQENGTLSERGLTSKEMLKREDLEELIKTIHEVNPAIQIPDDLLKK